MKKISENEYKKAEERIEELLLLVDDNTPKEDTNLQELVALSDLVENYETEHYQIGTPSLKNVIELRMFENKLKQKDLALLLETSASRISEYMNGKRDITIEIARALHKKLNIDSDIILQGWYEKSFNKLKEHLREEDTFKVYSIYTLPLTTFELIKLK